ncbi:MAG TPA: isoaspartyl peptidase/L-asparaginase [Bacteroidia bacterium]|nr:isoaspartyl peptidase/L-asparaginase [Bacteroidia bacterium]HNT80634.1 isoaspartyl peptidase/L-asparaginase [Bacteroidia bacterium]
MKSKNFSIAIHGGAGTIDKESLSKELENEYLHALEIALSAGHQILAENGSAIDAVEAAVISLEDCPLFNAGRGSVFTYEEKHEMDASIMCGKTLNAGAVTCVTQIKNPIVLSRKVMEESEFVMLSSAGAEEFAKTHHVAFKDDEYFYSAFRHQQWKQLQGSTKTQLDHSSEKKFGTVGAVALDVHGNLAAATSTGGMTNKRYNRIGDTPIIGSGTYANNKTCAVSCTGHGEYFIRSVTAYDISCLMEYKNFSLQQACNEVVHNKLKNFGGEGGLIAVDQFGNIELCFNSTGMYRASRKNNEIPIIAIFV